jgi:hypothetical protein
MAGGEPRRCWAVWSGRTAAAGRDGRGALEQAALRSGDGGRADSDLDAVLALFAAAERAEDRFGGRRGVANFLAELDSQVIPADTLAERGVRGPAVRLLTAHRAKGLQWRLVVVAGVQEGGWPDLRRRGSLLAADRLDAQPAGRTARGSCSPRASPLPVAHAGAGVAVVSAVRSSHDDGAQPSRLLAEIAGDDDAVGHVVGRPARPLSVSGLVAHLRATAVVGALPAPLRAAATRRLAALATATDDDGRPLVPAAHPDRWWGLLDPPCHWSGPRRRSRCRAARSRASSAARCSGSSTTRARPRWRATPRWASGRWCTCSPTPSRAASCRPTSTCSRRRSTASGRRWGSATWQAGERVEAARRCAGSRLARRDDHVRRERASSAAPSRGRARGARAQLVRPRRVDADGAVHVADLKTAQPGPATPSPGISSASTSSRCSAGRSTPADDVRSAPASRPGEAVDVAGAELVLLRVEHSAPGCRRCRAGAARRRAHG